MKIFILSDIFIDESLAFNTLSSFSEPEEITILYDIPALKERLDAKINKGNEHIDLIIINRSQPDELAIEYSPEVYDDSLIDWIRASEWEYSDSKFNFRSVPVVLFDDRIHHPYNLSVGYNDTKYDGIYHSRAFPSGNIFIELLSRPIYNWIQKVGSELDLLDLDLEFDFSRSRINKVEPSDFNILSKSFFKTQCSLDYLWIGKNIEIIEYNYDELDRLLKKSLNDRFLRNEKEFHRNFLKHELMIRGEDYKRLLYEKHFYIKNSRSYIESDFLNIPHRYSPFGIEFFEVKLPNQRVINESSMKPTRYLRKSMEQVGRKYKHYAEDQTNHAEMINRIKDSENMYGVPVDSSLLKNPRFTLLIGTLTDKEENIALAKKYGRGFDVTVHCYEDMKKKYERLHQRLKRFRLH